MKRTLLLLGLVLAAGFFYSSALAANTYFGTCEEKRCVTIGFCDISCSDCAGSPGNRKCAPPE